MITSTFAVLSTFALHLGSIQLASAAEPEDPSVPEGTISSDPATGGTTEIEGQGQFAAADQEARTSEDATELDISAGGLLSTGNAFAAAVTGQGRFRLRRGIHQVGVQVAGNYGVADIESQTTRYLFIADPLTGNRVEEQIDTRIERENTVANLQGMARYDVFFAKRWSGFLMATARRDRFQGLDLRFNLDPGVAVHVLTRANHRLWFEAGYDFQYDIREDEARLAAEAAGEVRPDKTATNHAVRLYAGYTNNLSEFVTFDTGAEYLQSVLVAGRFRVNWLSSLTTQLADRVSVGLTFALRYENQPLPEVLPLDTVTSVLLGVRFI